MSRIEELQDLNLEKITSNELKQAVKSLLDDYETEADKDVFLDVSKDSIDKVYELVVQYAPQAFDIKIDAQKEGNTRGSITMEIVVGINEELESCRRAIREYNRQKREAGGNKIPKKSRLTKLKENLIGIINLIPPDLKVERRVLHKTEKVLITMLNQLQETWKLNKINSVKDAIKQNLKK